MDDVYARIANTGNPHQGSTKRVLAVCSAGLLRSPTIAHVLSAPPYSFNTRCAGVTKEYALVVLDDVLLHWADEIVCAEEWIAEAVEKELDRLGLSTLVVDLGIPDRYGYGDPELVKLIRERYEKLGKTYLP